MNVSRSTKFNMSIMYTKHHRRSL